MNETSDGVEVGDTPPVDVVDTRAGTDAPGGAEPSDEDHGTAGPDGDAPAAGDDVAPPDGGGSPDEAQGEAADVPAPRRRSSLRRGVVVGALALVVALALSAFATSGSAGGDPDQRFLDATRSRGLAVAGAEQQALLVSAARKICDRRDSHGTVAQRRATALSLEELGSVAQTFGADARGFTSLALETYCPN